MAPPLKPTRFAVPRTGAPVVIKPSWQSTLPDTGDPTRLGPEAWNTERFVTGGNPGDVLMRDPSSSTGASWATPPPFISADEVAAGDAATLGSANTHSDGNDSKTLASANTYAEQCEAEALADAKAYADAQDGTTLAAAKSYADGGDTAMLTASKGYTDTKDLATLTSAQSYADSHDTTTLSSANSYTDTKSAATLTSAKSYADTGDAATLQQAKSYTDATPRSLTKRATLATPIPLPVNTPVNVDTTLWSYPLPANALATNGDVLQIQTWGQFLPVGASRTITLTVGTLTIGSLSYSGSQLKHWVLDVTIVRASATAQSAVARTDGDPALIANVQFPTLDLTQAQTIALKAKQGGTPATSLLQIGGALVTQW